MQGAPLIGYFYNEGYLRTSSREFTVGNLTNRMIHLTNDAVQKGGKDYGKYEMGNKVSFEEFSTFLQKEKEINFYEQVLPLIKERVGDTMGALAN